VCARDGDPETVDSVTGVGVRSTVGDDDVLVGKPGWWDSSASRRRPRLDLAIPNFLIQELAGADHYDSWQLGEYIDYDILGVEDGYIPAPEKPGLGVSVSDELFEDGPDVDLTDPPLFVDPNDFHVPERFLSWDEHGSDLY